MPAALATRPHFSLSAAIQAPNGGGVIRSTVAPSRLNCFRISGRSCTAVTSPSGAPDGGRRNTCRREPSERLHCFLVGDAGLRDRGCVRQDRIALQGFHTQRTQSAGAKMRHGGPQAAKREVRMPCDDFDGRSACTIAGHVQPVSLRGAVEKSGREVAETAHARRGERQLARILPGKGEQVRHRSGGHPLPGTLGTTGLPATMAPARTSGSGRNGP